MSLGGSSLESVDIELAGFHGVGFLGVVLIASFQVLEHLFGDWSTGVQSLATEVGVEEITKGWNGWGFDWGVASSFSWSGWEGEGLSLNSKVLPLWIFVETNRFCH